MYDVVINLLWRGSVPELTNGMQIAITCTACALVVLGFTFISVALYKLILYVCKF